MKREDFISFLSSQSNIKISDFLKEKLLDFINSESSQNLFNKITQKIIHYPKNYINDSDLAEILSQVLKEVASQKAKESKIKGWRASRFEEEIILSEYHYKLSKNACALEWL